VAGISKQAVSQYAKRQAIFDAQIANLIVQANELRRAHPGCGVEKMYYTLKPDYIGRDRFVELFMALGYRIKKKKNYRKTTFAGSMYYPNLIKGMEINKPSAIWQSDITYIKVGENYCYGVFITDVYSRKIVGYCVSDHMRATANVKALTMALKKHDPPDIHHSDRGSQYTYKAYTEVLNRMGCKISMGLTAQDNAYAERIHRTIKEEYLSYWKPKTLRGLKQCIAKAVKQYNSQRPHNNLKKQSPNQFIEQCSLLTSQQRTTLTIFNDNY